MCGYRPENGCVQFVSAVGTRPPGNGEGYQGLQRPFEADITGTKPRRHGGGGHQFSDQVVGQQVHPNYIVFG